MYHRCARARIGPLLSLGAGLLALALVDPARIPGLPLCPFRAATGLACPGCGSLRALHNLLRGHAASAFELNPLLVCLLPATAAWFVARDLRRAGGSPPPPPRLRSVWAVTLLAGVLAFWVLRNLPGWPFQLPAP